MFTDRQLKEVTGIFLLLISVILLLSLTSFNINDIKLLAEARPAHNLIGPLGAYFSDFLRAGFGYLSFTTVVIFVLSGWSFLKNGATADIVERVFSLLYLTVTASVMLSLVHDGTTPHFSGGYTGQFLSKIFTGIFGEIGAFLVVLGLNIIGLVLLGIVSFSLIIADLGSRDGNLLLSKIKNFLKNIIKKIFIVNYDKGIPLTDIESAMKKKGKKEPWITKKKLIVGNNDAEKFTKEKETKLLEHIARPADTDQLPKSWFKSRALVPLAPLNPFAQLTKKLRGIEHEPVYSYANGNIKNFDLSSTIDTHEERNARSDISFVNYTEDDEPFKIKTNRIKSVVIEHDVKPEMIIDEFEDDEENELLEDEDDDESNLLELSKQYDEDRPTSYIPRVFEKIPLSEKYIVPTDFLEMSAPVDAVSWKAEAKRNSELLVKTLSDFGIESRVINVHRGPVITLYEIQIAPGIKVNKIVGLSDDLAMALAAYKVRVVAPIPGKSAIGVEIPNTSREMVTIGDIIKSHEYSAHSMKLKVGLGKDILGKPVTIDLKKQPHLLIAGATGSGKSICLNSIICDLIYNYDPNNVRFILIDPKMVELQLYNGIPHLLTPVITETYMAPRALKWAVAEMERRYKLLSEVNARDIDKYNERIAGYEEKYETLPYIVIMIDELADLMMIAAKEIEGSITRIAQKARAVGIHLILATQRPSVDIITGIIKANFPARIAFQVAQKIDSRTILDQNGAETLLGKGDMLYQSPVSSFPVRVQGAYITEEEIMKIVRHTRKYGKAKYVDIEDNLDDEDSEDIDDSADDALFVEAVKIIEETKKASASYLQRRLSIGYNRAARIIELAEERGYVGPQQGSKPREVYI